MDIQSLISTASEAVITAAVPVAVWYVRKFMQQHFSIKQIQAELNQAGITVSTEQLNFLVNNAVSAAKEAWESAIATHTVPTTRELKVNNTTTTAVVTAQSDPEPAPAPQLPGRWVIGNDFICHFPVVGEKTNQFLTPDSNLEEYEKLKNQVASYAEKVDMTQTAFYASIYA